MDVPMLADHQGLTSVLEDLPEMIDGRDGWRESGNSLLSARLIDR